MESPEELRQRVHREQQRLARLRLATTRLDDAQQERIWAIVGAHKAGLSIRQIASATTLSPSRVHQLLQENEAREIPEWLSHLRDLKLDAEKQCLNDGQPSPSQARLTEELEVFRWCIDWLARLERGEEVVVNVRPETDMETECVRFDRPRVLRVLGRIAADLDELAHRPLENAEERIEPAEAP